MATVTGRLSSTEPNLQNIPTRTEVGKRMREMFVPGKGYDLLMSCDYSQVELRVMASIARMNCCWIPSVTARMSMPGPLRKSSGCLWTR